MALQLLFSICSHDFLGQFLLFKRQNTNYVFLTDTMAPSTNKTPEHCSPNFHCNWLHKEDKGKAKQIEFYSGSQGAIVF